VRMLSKQLTLAAILVILLAGALFVRFREEPDPGSAGADYRSGSSVQMNPALTAKITGLEAREKQADATVWVKEILAQECGRTFEVLWDAINRATNKLEVAAAFPVGEVALGRWETPQILPHGIELRSSSGDGAKLLPGQWQRFVGEFARDGWRLAQVEFRQTQFETDEAGRPRRSRFYFSAHLLHSTRAERAVLEGDLDVDWGTARMADGHVAVEKMDARRLSIKTRRGGPAFQEILSERITPPEKSRFIDPLLVHDLDGDGLPEIILAAKNLVYRRDNRGGYTSGPLCRFPPGVITAAIIGDFDGDGAADFVCAKPEGLLLFKGSPSGAFNEPGRLVWPASPLLQNALVLTCGDIDGDGAPDLFVGQYKVPSLGQIFRPGFHDANDGYPAYLLRNDGRGNFTDATPGSGLEKKRWRRVFSASFANLNDDARPDLIVVSDFAGLDLYRNDGHGLFTDATREWAGESHAFGMGHALADFNADGRPDLLMIGMTSPTVDRLGGLGVWRDGSGADQTMPGRMTHGNRLYLGKPGDGFTQSGPEDSIARSGWSWGCGAFDFDNDGFPDAYIANGHESRETTRDYEPEFWLHDIFVDGSVDDAVATAYFTSKYSNTRGRGWSYGGYEKNRLFLNQDGRSFTEAAWLMGVALEEDCRNVVAADLDGDGRVDLLVTTLEVWPETRQTLRVYRNALPDSGNWIGFHLRKEGAGGSPVNARALIRYAGRSAVREIVTGDSFRSQHPDTIHFGIGSADRVESAEIRWPDGQTNLLREPAVNRYHTLRRSEESGR
jgi:hypothetical protein